MNAATLAYIKQRFSSYYRTSSRRIPPALAQREWGFIFFEPSAEVHMRRHMSFSSRQELTDYIRSMVPAHAYYSTAYYAYPAAPTMNDKKWTGADLIFDLDADHVVRGVPYDVMLARVKEETQKLVGMLSGELGFSEKTMELAFSGGRGYHIHIRDLEIRDWGSHERRELVDYVCGIGLDPAIMLRAHLRDRGWPARYREALAEEVTAIGSMNRGEAMAELTGNRGIGEKTAAAFLDRLPELAAELRDASREIVLNSPKNRILQAVIAGREEQIRERVRARAALTDEPVTTDIKRLIRLPGSLHGGSGFRATPLSVAELGDFDPLVDAVVFGEESMKIELGAARMTVPLLGNRYELCRGVNAVPEALAVFLCCRNFAEIAGGGMRTGA
ncbi:MAG: DNA primase catalytic subunit PriS [Methanomicrobiaceae archaeon]|nr:DNA primase catalytic subunit PriS [Methanomicrobiaceae archaeon]